MLLAVVMVLALCACGGSGDKADANSNGDYHLVLKLSHVYAPTEQLTVEMQQVIKGHTVILSWCCTQCEVEWPVSLETPDFVERRQGSPDRRRTPRQDRRRP